MSQYNGDSLIVLPEVKEFVERHGIGRVEPDRIALLDEGQPIEWCKPPSRILGDEALSHGLAYLKQAKPKVALVLTLHTYGGDFERLVVHNHVPYLHFAPVVGVEAEAVRPFTHDSLPMPVRTAGNPWLSAFQDMQFPWFEARGTTMLPLEPQYGRALGGHLALLDSLIQKSRAGTLGYGAEVSMHITHVLSSLRAVYRAWGLVAQFGRWLQHPQVIRLAGGSNARLPIILGCGHTYEATILDLYCGLDVITCDFGRKIDPATLNPDGGKRDVAAETAGMRLYMQETAAGYVLIRDLAARPPV